ncbi:MAG TPA: hypothetical protein VNJ04_02610 [Gemmatimonadaceae bacterium]|nr:hypothetical protein [Gemmatimonadaceae bacterium]
MPEGFVEPKEAQLDKGPRVLDFERRAKLASWWLPSDRQSARTPNFDIVSTCTVDGAPGLLLIEAKAHAEELGKEEAGRRLDTDASDERKASHVTIGAAIQSAATGFGQCMGGSCGISRDPHYQMSNRFAWAWKLTELGVPVVMLYLGFLKAHDMSKHGEVPFADGDAWETLVRLHSAPLFSGNIWNNRWLVNGVPLIPLIKSLELPLDQR